MPLGIKRATRQVVNASLSFEGTRDPRRAKQVKHGLPGLLRLLVLTGAAGALRLRRVEDMGAMVCTEMLQKLGLAAAPSDTTYAELLARMGTEGLEEELHRYNKACLAGGAMTPDKFRFRVMVADGKGGAKGLGEAPNKVCKTTVYNAQHDKCWHLFQLRMALVTSEGCLCLGQKFLEDKMGEMTGFIPLLNQIVAVYKNVADIVTADCGLNSAANAQAVLDNSMAYLFGLKETAPKRLRQAHAALADSPILATTVERAGGKQVTRTLRCVPAPKELEFPGIAQVLKVTLEILDSAGNCAVDERIFITSLPVGKLRDDELLTLVRMHWGIENGSNWTADMVFEEDTHVMCGSGQAVLVLSWLRLLALNLTAMVRMKLGRGKARASWSKTLMVVLQALTRCVCGECEQLVLDV